MTIEKINDLLQALQSKPGEESVMEIAYALMDWMKIERAERPKPIQPSTERLRGYLQTRKVFKQPDLVDLSAPGQTMSVRMGSLKKIQKNSMHFLVDKSPGMSAWQNEPTVIRKMSAKPYMVHFVTDARYDRLLLVLHQNGQKRIMTLRARLSQTQYNRILKELKDIALIQSKYEIQEKAWKSMDLKEVNKLFYKEVKVRYDALVAMLAPASIADRKKKEEESDKTTEAHKQFAVRLIGRYIFCWFLKEKEIIAPEIISSKAIESTPDFFNRVLRVLFFQVLNKQPYPKRELPEEVPADLLPHFHRIPYLNGGLFDPSDEDRMFAELELNDWLHNFVKNVLEEYDFTVDESSPSYQQIAIDPEMLGRIFENLLASINPETEKLANERKAFGAFYTPREIVEYMVDQSLRTYLETHLLPPENDDEEIDTEPSMVKEGPMNLFSTIQPKQLSLGENKDVEKRAHKLLREGEYKRIREKLDKLFGGSGDEKLFNEKEADEIRRLLNNCKVLDPACGSGAFPMGILYKIEELLEAIGTTKSKYELRKEILSHNIYGVDIMPMAAEISRLRAWLALVMVSDYKANETRNNFNVKALPNLDFKFVCANTLVDIGYDKFFALVEKSNNSAMIALADQIKRLAEIKNEYFDAANNHIDKSQLREEFENRKIGIKGMTETLGKNYNIEKFLDRVDEWTPFDDSKASPFFSSAWMFDISDGFDIVIGNPPYVRQEDANIDKKYFQNAFETFSGKADLYVFFYERSIKLLKNLGSLVFITSSKFLKAAYGLPLLMYLVDRTKLNEVIDFNDLPLFDGATVYPVIISATRQNANNFRFTYFNLKELPNERIQEFLSHGQSLNLTKSKFVKDGYKFLNDSTSAIVEKMRNGTADLGKLYPTPLVGVKTGCNEAYITSIDSPMTKGYLFGKDIKRYQQPAARERIIFPYSHDYKLLEENKKDLAFIQLNEWKDKLANRAIIKEGLKTGGKKWFEYQQINKTLNYAEEYIVYPNVSSGNQFTLTKGSVIDMTAFIIKSKSRFLLGVLNSKLIEFLMNIMGIERRGGYIEYKSQYVERIPLPIVSIEGQDRIAGLVDKILNAKAADHKTDTNMLERQIDIMVYHLYNFTINEARVIDETVSEEEWEKYKLETSTESYGKKTKQ